MNQQEKDLFLFLLLLFWFPAGYRPAVEEIESMASQALCAGHRNALALKWGRIGRGRKEGCERDKQGEWGG